VPTELERFHLHSAVLVIEQLEQEPGISQGAADIAQQWAHNPRRLSQKERARIASLLSRVAARFKFTPGVDASTTKLATGS